MAPHRTLAYEPVFQASPLPSLVLDTGLYIQDANPAYLEATHRTRDELVGAHVFTAFPENPRCPDGEGVANVRASLRRVLDTGEADRLGVQRYDIPRSQAPGEFEERYWLPVNTPIRGPSGELTGVLHAPQDVTGFRDDLIRSLAFYRAEADAQDGSAGGPDARFADYAAGAMANARLYADLTTEVAQLRAALTSRATIDQAKGVIMGKYLCGPDEAFRILTRLSQTRNLKVRELASHLIDRVSRGDTGNRDDPVPGGGTPRNPGRRSA